MRSDSHATDHFDLLPFISILMCVLGVLLLVTVSMSAVSMGSGASELWVSPKTTAATKQPILVEWDGKTAVIHHEEGNLSVPWEMPAARNVTVGGGSTPDVENRDKTALEKELDRLAALRETHYVLIAVRPSGFSGFHPFAQAFRDRGISIGYEPISQTRAVELRAADRVTPANAKVGSGPSAVAVDETKHSN